MKFGADGHNFYQSLHSTSPDFLLTGSCVDLIFGAASSRGAGAAGHERAGFCRSLALQKLCQAKISNFQNLWKFVHMSGRLGVFVVNDASFKQP